MSSLQSHAQRSMRWNIAGGIIYQGLLTGHQILLYSSINPHLYGIVSTIFSLIYLSAILFDAGFKDTVAPFFSISMNSKHHFIKILLKQFIYQLTIILGIIFISSPFILYIVKKAHPFFTWQLMFILIGTILSEWINLLCKTIVQLNFCAKRAVFADTIRILGYMAIIWGYYFLYKSLTLFVIFTPLLIFSILSNTVLLHKILSLYRNLPEKSIISIPANLKLRIIHARVSNFFNQLQLSLFSANFLIPFFSFYFGASHAGVLRIASSISRLITSFFQHVFGSTSSAVLAHAKHENQEIKHHIFYYLTNQMNLLLYAIFIIIFINTNNIIAFGNASTKIPSLWFATMLFLFINLANALVIVHEKLFITEEKATHLAIFNFINLAFSLIILSYAAHLPQITTMLLLLATRVLYFILISSFSFRVWGIRPQLGLTTRSFISYLIIILIIFAAQ